MFSYILFEIIQLVILFQKENYCCCLTAQIITQSNKLGKKAYYFNSWIRTQFTCLMPCVTELAETHLNVVSKEETKQTALLI